MKGVPERFESDYESAGDSPGFLLWQVTNLWQRQMRAVLKDVDLTHVQFVLLASLAWLCRDGGLVTQSAVAQHARIDAMMTSQVLRTLEQKGFIARVAHPQDTRANALSVTPQGTQLAQRAIGLVEEADRRFFGPLGADIPVFNDALQRLAGGGEE